MIKANSTVLFQGDSITDCNRNRDDVTSLGEGYPFMIATMLKYRCPELNLRFINRGVSGDRSIDLVNRWQEDCINLNPDYVSILVGINDCWRRYDSNNPTTVEEYEHNFRELLNLIKQKTDAEIILIEPFLLHAVEEREEWREDLNPKIDVVRKLAREYNATFISLDGIFAEKSISVEPNYWANDGVHPTPQGHALIADRWITKVYCDK